MSSDDTAILEYDALFYKRSAHSKVHKSKGASKIDGILSINIGKQTLSLVCAENDDSSGDDDDDEEEKGKMTWKKRRKKTSKAGPRGVVYSGKLQGELTASGIQENATLVLGTYDVEVVSLRSKPASAPASGKGSTVRRGVGSVAATKPTAGVPVKPAQGFKKTIGLHSVKPRGILPAKRKPVTQPTIKRPPAQPRKLLPNESTTQSAIVPPRAKVLRHSSDNVVNSQPAAPKAAVKRPPPTRWTPPTAVANIAVLPHIPLPASIRKVLRPHQVTGVDFLWKALTNENGAILADEMGLGKTLMSIAVVSAWHRTQREHSHVVVCPSSLVRNWEAEFDKWLGKASQPKRVVIRTGGEEGLQKIKAFAGNQSQKRAHRVGQVLIVSYDLFRMHTSVIQQAVDGAIGVLLVDEGHRLKNTSGSHTMTALESLQADSRLLISASPVQNNLSEFYSLVEFVRPGLLGDLSSFRKEFERPISAANRKNATMADRESADRQSRALEALTKSTILRRLQSEVLASVLPARTEVLLFCKLSDDQRLLYQSLTADRLKYLPGPGSSPDALETLTKLRKLCTHPTLLEETTTGKSSPCDLSSSGKLAVLSLLLREIRSSADDDKVVIVSNFTSALSFIEELILKPNNLSYLRLDGSVNAQNRQTLVDTFNRTSAARSFCFLLSAKAGGCGLNLVGANKLVMFDPGTFVLCLKEACRFVEPHMFCPFLFSQIGTRRRIFKPWVESTGRGRHEQPQSIDCFQRGLLKKSFISDSYKRAL